MLFQRGVMQCWSQHFMDAINHPLVTTSASVKSESISSLHDPGVRTDEPTVDEVIRAIKKLKNGGAAGSNGYSPRTVKCTMGSRALQSLFIRGLERQQHGHCQV